MFYKTRKPVSILVLLLVVSLVSGCFVIDMFKRSYSLNVTFEADHGTVEGIPAKPTKIKSGTLVELTAIPNVGYTFFKWEGVPEGMEGDNPLEFAIEKNMDITAVFHSDIIEYYSLTVTVNDDAMGAASSDPAASDQIAEGTSITITATPAVGYKFMEWTGVPEGKELGNPVEFQIDKDTNVVATFEEIPVITEGFEGFDMGGSIPSFGWYPDDCEAVIVDDSLNSGNQVLMITAKNWDSLPVIEMSIPEGYSLADYKALTFRDRFPEGAYVFLCVYADSNDLSGSEFKPTTESIALRMKGEGNWKNAHSDWETISIELENPPALEGKIYLAFGISAQGSKSDGNPADTVWYADDIKLIP